VGASEIRCGMSACGDAKREGEGAAMHWPGLRLPTDAARRLFGPGQASELASWLRARARGTFWRRAGKQESLIRCITRAYSLPRQPDSVGCRRQGGHHLNRMSLPIDFGACRISTRVRLERNTRCT